MGEMEIKICIAAESESIYRFSEFPVEIGRSEDCQLSIHHEAIARKLCRVWIETGGMIHVEEQPNLTNPIFENGKKIQGGIAKPQLSLRVGPVTIDIRDSSAPLLPEKHIRFRNPWFLVVILFCGMAVSTFLWQRNQTESERHKTMIADFPRAVPLPPPNPRRGTDVPTDMLIQLAQTEFMRLPEDLHRKKHAIQLMWRAEKHGPPESPKSQRCREIRMAWKTELDRAYRLEIVRLMNALKEGNDDAIRQSSSQLQLYLAGTNKKHLSWLKYLESKGEDQ